MSERQAIDDTPSLAPSVEQGKVASQGFIRRFRLPLTLAVVAICLYASSILYILFGRGQI